MSNDDHDTKKRRGIQSVEIGLRVLAAVAAYPKASSLTAISQRSEISPSQTHRYLSSLIASGMVRQESSSSLYDLDAGAIRIGLAALSRLDILGFADRIMTEYSRSSGRTCLISIWGDAGATIIRWYAGNPPVITSLSIGSLLPLFQSATGQVFYAFGDPAEMDRYGLEEARRVRQPIGDFSTLRRSVREDVYAAISGDLVPGLRATAVPIFDLQGRLILVAAALASAAHDQAEDQSALQGLLDAGRELTESVGGVWPEGSTFSLEPEAPKTKRRPKSPSSKK